MPWPRLNTYGISENPITSTPYAQGNNIHGNTPPVPANAFLLMTGAPFLLMTNADFLLME